MVRLTAISNINHSAMCIRKSPVHKKHAGFFLGGGSRILTSGPHLGLVWPWLYLKIFYAFTSLKYYWAKCHLLKLSNYICPKNYCQWGSCNTHKWGKLYLERKKFHEKKSNLVLDNENHKKLIKKKCIQNWMILHILGKKFKHRGKWKVFQPAESGSNHY